MASVQHGADFYKNGFSAVVSSLSGEVRQMPLKHVHCVVQLCMLRS